MKPLSLILLAVISATAFSSCATGPRAQTGTAVGAIGGAVVAGPVGLLAGGAVGNAYGGERDRGRR
jgi:hypothetical protein